MYHRTRYGCISLVIVMMALLLSACGGGGNQLSYQVSGSASEAEVTYTDGEGNSHTETVALPWELGFSAGNSADYSVEADNTSGQGDISCVVLLGEKELGRADADYYASCQGSYKKSGSSLSNNFSSRRDVLPDGSPAGPQPTETPVPPTPTDVPSPTPSPEPTFTPAPPPDTTADFESYSNEEGTFGLRYPTGWAVVDAGDIIGVVSDPSMEQLFLINQDYSQPAGFVVGLFDTTTDFDSDDPVALLEERQAQIEEDGWQPQPVGDLETSEDGTVRRAWREYTGQKRGFDVHFVIATVVNGGNAAVFMGGRTGTAPEEHSDTAAAILDSMQVEYADPGPVSETAEPTRESAADEVPTDVMVEGRIVFSSNQDGNFEIYTANTDGSQLVRLTDDSAYDGTPAWSPDGNRIAFVSDRDGNHEIYSMNADGSDVTRLTDNSASDLLPAWSPNSQLIAFMSTRGGSYDIYLMQADGSKATPVITSEGDDTAPTWSHTTQEFAFVSDLEGDTSDLYIADGAGQVRRVTQGMGDVFAPHWSPNGRFIAFGNKSEGNFDIYIIKPDGSGLEQVTDNKALDGQPKWSPDGNFLMFISDRDGNSEIYITDETGIEMRVTDNDALDTNPAWGPMESE